ncbi:hypothetical protein [Caminibacter sp.]
MIKRMFYTVVFLLFVFTHSQAKEIPINKVVNVVLPIGVPSIIEFPFEIKAVKATSFVYKVKISEELNSLKPLDEKNSEKKKNTKKTNALLSKHKPILISRTKKVLTITPKKEGRMNLIVWGYKYPIVLDIKTKLMKTDGYDRYITFLDYSQDRRKAQKFESTSHEKVITKLIRYIYNNKIPQGYKYQAGTLDYTTNGIRLIQVKSLIGHNYKAEEWIVENKTKNSIILYPQMFYSNGIYAVSFENNKLNPNEKVRMFIVAKNTGK